jgi:hypothetical protein
MFEEYEIKVTSGTRDLRTPVVTPLQPLRTLCLVAIIGNFPKITFVGPTLRHLYPHR